MKMIKIPNCGECPHFYGVNREDSTWGCNPKGTVIILGVWSELKANGFKIPEAVCPLEDYPNG
jgi:hypothetical protein